MEHVMLDLETMGNGSEAAIVAIGACFFDPQTGEVGEEFYRVVSLQSSVDAGLQMDASTVQWWMKQGDDARFVFKDPEAVDLVLALADFDSWIDVYGSRDRVKVWGNGASFDNVILRNAYHLVWREPAWKFWNDRDVRTVVELGRVVGFDPKKDMPFEGVQHNALADAVHQARYVSAVYRRLGLVPSVVCGAIEMAPVHGNGGALVYSGGCPEGGGSTLHYRKR